MKIKTISKDKILFFAIFMFLNFYFLVIKSELYESSSSVIVKDLSSPTSIGGIGGVLLGIGGGNSQLQDSKVVEEYILSHEMFDILDRKFKLVEHYKSDAIDFIERLPKDATKEKELKFYRKRVATMYDEISGILHISFRHTDANMAKEILEFMVGHVEKRINEIDKKQRQKQLKFIEIEYENSKKRLQEAIEKVKEYQDKYLMLDPSSKAAVSAEIIAKLESELVQKRIELLTKEAYLNEDSYEIQKLKSEIKEISKSVKKMKESLAGAGQDKLNKLLFGYEQLKMLLELNTEIYKNTMIQLETLKLELLKEAKTLSVISRPNLPDGYSYPDKPKVFITILILSLFMYGIYFLISAIIRDHKE